MGNAVSRENRAVSVDGGTKESVTVAEQFAILPSSLPSSFRRFCRIIGCRFAVEPPNENNTKGRQGPTDRGAPDATSAMRKLSCKFLTDNTNMLL